jgi:hypothetical protein
MLPYATLVDRQKQRSVDDVMTAYVQWREASLRVREAYQAWHTASNAEVDAYPAYTAALDREQAASETYARLITELERRTGRRSDKARI